MPWALAIVDGACSLCECYLYPRLPARLPRTATGEAAGDAGGTSRHGSDVISAYIDPQDRDVEQG